MGLPDFHEFHFTIRVLLVLSSVIVMVRLQDKRERETHRKKEKKKTVF